MMMRVTDCACTTLIHIRLFILNTVDKYGYEFENYILLVHFCSNRNPEQDIILANSLVSYKPVISLVREFPSAGW